MEIASQILKLLSTAFCAAGAVVMTLAIFTPHTLLIKDIQAETALGWPLASVWLGFLSGELIIQTPLTKPVLEPFQYDNSFLCRDVCYNLRMGGRGAVVGLTTAAALLVAGATLSSVSLAPSARAAWPPAGGGAVLPAARMATAAAAISAALGMAFWTAMLERARRDDSGPVTNFPGVSLGEASRYAAGEGVWLILAGTICSAASAACLSATRRLERLHPAGYSPVMV
uniref:Uncharacterized protein n=1 Tax=Tetraselmis sp. GSL018 TaxID=582737 RepID=A0A061RFE6_9CHLO